MINQDPNPSPSSTTTVVNTVPVGGIAQVFRSGDAYKAVGESVSRAAYPALSAEFPRNGAMYSEQASVPISITVRGMAYGNGVMVAVCYSTTTTTQIFYSRDRGRTWRVANIPVGAWNAVTFGNGKFVAVATTISGTSAGAVTSTDGVNWVAAGNLSTTAGWSGVAWSDSLALYVAVAGAGSTTAASSTDGVTWTPRTLPTSSGWSAVTFGNGKFIAVSQGTAGAYSTNGTSWTACTLPAGSYGFVTYGNGAYVACGFIGSPCLASSPDGITWTARTTPPAAGTSGLGCVAFGDGVFLGLSDTVGICCISYDGIKWEERVQAASSNGMTGIVFGAGAFVALRGVGGASGVVIYTENLTDSDWLYLSGTPGNLIRVK